MGIGPAGGGAVGDFCQQRCGHKNKLPVSLPANWPVMPGGSIRGAGEAPERFNLILTNNAPQPCFLHFPHGQVSGFQERRSGPRPGGCCRHAAGNKAAFSAIRPRGGKADIYGVCRCWRGDDVVSAAGPTDRSPTRTVICRPRRSGRHFICSTATGRCPPRHCLRAQLEGGNGKDAAAVPGCPAPSFTAAHLPRPASGRDRSQAAGAKGKGWGQGSA